MYTYTFVCVCMNIYIYICMPKPSSLCLHPKSQSCRAHRRPGHVVSGFWV